MPPITHHLEMTIINISALTSGIHSGIVLFVPCYNMGILQHHSELRHSIIIFSNIY